MMELVDMPGMPPICRICRWGTFNSKHAGGVLGVRFVCQLKGCPNFDLMTYLPFMGGDPLKKKTTSRMSLLGTGKGAHIQVIAISSSWIFPCFEYLRKYLNSNLRRKKLLCAQKACVFLSVMTGTYFFMIFVCSAEVSRYFPFSSRFVSSQITK